MNRKTLSIAAAALVLGMLAISGAQAAPQAGAKAGPQPGAKALEAPRMPYVFAMYCLMCHKVGVQIGPTGIFDMLSKSGNPLHEQYIRNNVRFGYNAMPAFRLSEVSPKELDVMVDYMKALAVYRKANPGYQPEPAREGGGKK